MEILELERGTQPTYPALLKLKHPKIPFIPTTARADIKPRGVRISTNKTLKLFYLSDSNFPKFQQDSFRIKKKWLFYSTNSASVIWNFFCNEINLQRISYYLTRLENQKTGFCPSENDHKSTSPGFPHVLPFASKNFLNSWEVKIKYGHTQKSKKY